MSVAYLRFYAELNDLVAPERRGVTFAHAFTGTPSVKDVIESMGVPHTEVDLILADGASVDFSWRLHDGARISVYPVFESLDLAGISRVRPAPLREVRFVLDVHLGRLARYLRMLGFDALWPGDVPDQELARLSVEQRRTLLTRDRGLLARRAITHGVLVRSADAVAQAREIVERLDLAGSIAPFRRCLRCNALVEIVRKEDVAAALPPLVRERHTSFRRCPSCGRVYWPGSHHARMQRLVDAVVRPSEPRR